MAKELQYMCIVKNYSNEDVHTALGWVVPDNAKSVVQVLTRNNAMRQQGFMKRYRRLM